MATTQNAVVRALKNLHESLRPEPASNVVWFRVESLSCALIRHHEIDLHQLNDTALPTSPVEAEIGSICHRCGLPPKVERLLVDTTIRKYKCVREYGFVPYSTRTVFFSSSEKYPLME